MKINYFNSAEEEEEQEKEEEETILCTWKLVSRNKNDTTNERISCRENENFSLSG